MLNERNKFGIWFVLSAIPLYDLPSPPTMYSLGCGVANWRRTFISFDKQWTHTIAYGHWDTRPACKHRPHSRNGSVTNEQIMNISNVTVGKLNLMPRCLCQTNFDSRIGAAHAMRTAAAAAATAVTSLRQCSLSIFFFRASIFASSLFHVSSGTRRKKARSRLTGS